MSSSRIVHKVARGSKGHHYHKLPGFISRVVHGIGEGTIVRCECGTYFIWVHTFSYVGPFWEWKEMSPEAVNAMVPIPMRESCSE